ncbi:hypothetical protein [Streptomyces heilongjiangensis]|uniref:Gram-positive cocci surface proteins LPxTG domain-containing protein n=1 Tax=Streptomyces heilongjiangensis TaxID=945052 RepID=A0ABW1BEA8_9ACTN|nr:hypothetical protein [Streptomyces heilongjiangensis]MDC2949335.1 hypothetical protein [Streptomyces heilongjiangensis]
MRSARMLFATAAATAVLAITAPGAYAGGDEWDREDQGYSKEHHKDGHHDGPRGGVHTGGGALTAAQNDEWTPEGKEEKSWGKKDGHHDGPRGGVHTGGGALAAAQNDEWTSEGKEEKSWGAEDKQKEESGDQGKESWKEDKESWKGDHDKGGWKGEHDKPRGGMHTGGGALASPAMTAGGLAVLAVAGTGVYALRRKNAGGSAA